MLNKLGVNTADFPNLFPNYYAVPVSGNDDE